MIGRVELWLRRVATYFSRSAWLGRLLRLAATDGDDAAHGLLIIQIDGLGYEQLRRALDAGSTPFLKQLLDHEAYKMHRLYAGVPASTAPFQAALFYGVEQAVPGFGFRLGSTGELVNMIQPAAVEYVESTLATHGDTPLLAGGSAYADIFTGGAAESHFCPTARGWGPALRQAGPLVAVLLVLSHAGSVLRTIVLLCIELVLAIVDFFRGILAGHGLLKELKFVPLRVFITILLREVSVISAKVDLARGLPVVHLNFLGYDEQAHRRGPESRFAHWTLKGIDRAIRVLWRAALSSQRRHYEVWIYSDHGQETAQPYEKLHGIEFAEAVARVFSRFEGRDIRYRTGDIWGEQLKRAQLFGGRWPDCAAPPA